MLREAVKRIPWDELITSHTHEIDTDSDLFCALKQKANSYKETHGKSLEVVLVDYAYGDRVTNSTNTVIKKLDGDKKLSKLSLSPFQNKSIPDDLLYAEIPLGLVIKNGLEIVGREVYSNEPASLGLIEEGSFIGVFEVANFITLTRSQVKASWEIFSGIKSFYSNLSFSNASQLKTCLNKLKKSLKLERFNVSNVRTIHALFKELNRSSDDRWVCQIAFFPQEWLPPLIDNSRAAISAEEKDIERAILEIAWRSSQAIRDEGIYQEVHGLWNEFKLKVNEQSENKIGFSKSDDAAFFWCAYMLYKSIVHRRPFFTDLWGLLDNRNYREYVSKFLPLGNNLGAFLYLSHLLIVDKKAVRVFPRIKVPIQLQNEIPFVFKIKDVFDYYNGRGLADNEALAWFYIFVQYLFDNIRFDGAPSKNKFTLYKFKIVILKSLRKIGCESERILNTNKIESLLEGCSDLALTEEFVVDLDKFKELCHLNFLQDYEEEIFRALVDKDVKQHATSIIDDRKLPIGQEYSWLIQFL